jgi:phage terminase large subunit GpA-like protein
MTQSTHVVADAFARGFRPDPNLPIDEWADRYMIIPKDSGASEYGRYRSSRTPHARQVMRCLSPSHQCKRVVVKGASQMLKTQVALNFFGASVHQAPAGFLWVLPTGKLMKRGSTRIAKTIAAVPELAERVASPRSRDSINTIDSKEFKGGSLTIVTSGAAANLSELSCRYLVYDEIDRSEKNVDSEGASWKLAEARQTSFERNKKSYYPSSPKIEGESEIDELYKMGTQQEALADCLDCGHEQPLIFERLVMSDDGQVAMYPCAACGHKHYEGDKTRMFVRGAWSDGVVGDGETVSFTISAMFLPYGWFNWRGLLLEYAAAKAKLDEGSEELMITFYNTRLARAWARKKEQAKYQDLIDRAEPYKLGTVPAGGLALTAAVDTQNDRLEFKVVAWGEGLECWIVDYQVIYGLPSDDSTWDKLDALRATEYRHAGGEMMAIETMFIDAGGGFTQDVYHYTYSRRRQHVFAIRGESRPARPIINKKPTIVDINHRGKVEKRGGQLWFVGTDTAKDYLATRWMKTEGPGAVHFSSGLPDDYYKQLTAEFRVHVYKKGRKVSVWEKKNGDRNEAFDLMVYNLAAAHHLGLDKKPEGWWQARRNKLNPLNRDLFKVVDLVDLLGEPGKMVIASEEVQPSVTATVADALPPAILPVTHAPPEAKAPRLVSRGKISLVGTRRGGK